MCSVMYIGVGAVQLVAGIFFLISLPVFKVGSNVWTGVWNVVVGVGGAVFSSVGDLSPSKHRILLYLTITVLVLNLINLVVLELGEWRILMPDKVKATLQNHNLQTLVLYARMTTSISSALAVIIAFVDAQFMFCWLEHSLRPRHNPLDHKETVSDIEYIIPRAKTGSMGKNNPHNLYNQYQAAAQSWVFDSDTVGSTNSHAPTHARANSEHHLSTSPYGKLQHYTNSSKTVVLRRKSTNTTSHQLITHGDDDDNHHREPLTKQHQPMNGVPGDTRGGGGGGNRLQPQPVVLVEGLSSAGNDERHLQFMTSFSRTPSPVHPRSESSSPTSNPAPIYECLERLTEPSVYRSRLNTALEATTGTTEPQESRVSPSVSPRPHSVALASDQQQYASLMVELERTIVAKFPAQDDSRRQSQATGDMSQATGMHKQSASDADFSRQLEAALQLIQDLESPNTADTPSDAPQLGFPQAAEMASTSANSNPAFQDRTQHLLESKSIEDKSSDDENTWSSSSHEALHKSGVYGKVQRPLSQSAPQRNQLRRKHTTVIRIRDGTERTDENRIPKIDNRHEKDQETYTDSLESRLSSFQPQETSLLTSTTNDVKLPSFSTNNNYEVLNGENVPKLHEMRRETSSFSTNSLGHRSSMSSFHPKDLGRSASFTNSSEGMNEYGVSRIDGERVRIYRDVPGSRYSSLVQSKESGQSASFINNSSEVINGGLKVGRDHAECENNNYKDSRCSSFPDGEIGHQCNDSGVILESSNSEESVNSGKETVVVVKTNGTLANGSYVNGGMKECSVISEETEENGEKGVGEKNGSLKNGGNQNGVSSAASRSNSLKRSLSSVAKWRMFPKKRAARFVLTPELESTILKSESLLHLTDVELVARYDHNKSIQRKIEEKAWQKIIGASSTDSTC